MISLNGLGTPRLIDSINCLISSRPRVRVGLTVGGEHPLVDAPGGFDLDVGVGREQLRQPVLLGLGEQVGAGVQGASRGIQWIAGAASVPVGGLLDPAPALIQGVACQTDDVEGVQHRHSLG